MLVTQFKDFQEQSLKCWSLFIVAYMEGEKYKNVRRIGIFYIERFKSQSIDLLLFWLSLNSRRPPKMFEFIDSLYLFTAESIDSLLSCKVLHECTKHSKQKVHYVQQLKKNWKSDGFLLALDPLRIKYFQCHQDFFSC